MGCFIVPATEAVITTVATKIMESKEKELAVKKAAEGITIQDLDMSGKIPFSRKMKWLNNLLWGGSGLLAFEHVWHGEVVPFFPFLTGAMNPVDTAEMLHEMSTVGVTMAGLVTLVWAGMVLATSKKKERSEDKARL